MIQKQVDLQPFNTFGLSVKAKLFAEFSSAEELDAYIKEYPNEKLLILGGGSNLLLTKDFDGLVLKNNLQGIGIIKQNEESVFVKAYAGNVWHNLVLYTIGRGYGGIENLSLIPGSVGAAPLQNIGAYGVELKDVFHELEAYERATGELVKFTKEDCKFGYRESAFKGILKDKYIVLSVTLKLEKHPKINTTYGAINSRLKEMGVTTPSVLDVSDAVIHIRQSKLPDPNEIGNSGSFFKNPVVSKDKFDSLKLKFPEIANYPIDENHIKIAAGWLIDNAGWKGKTIENYGVHKNQALVLVNYGGAHGKDIYQLSEDIIASIADTYGIQLEREVNVL